MSYRLRKMGEGAYDVLDGEAKVIAHVTGKIPMYEYKPVWRLWRNGQSGTAVYPTRKAALEALDA